MIVETIEARRVLIALLRAGWIQREARSDDWEALLTENAAIRDYLRTIGLELVLDPDEGYAYLRNLTLDSDAPEDEEEESAGTLPRFIRRHQFTFDQSLLLVILRKRLAEHDLNTSDPRCIIARDELINDVLALRPGGSNEAARTDKLRTALRKLAEHGFIRPLKGKDDSAFEIARITKAYVDAQSLGGWQEQLERYGAIEGQRDDD
jgi:hypothetical protein